MVDFNKNENNTNRFCPFTGFRKTNFHGLNTFTPYHSTTLFSYITHD